MKKLMICIILAMLSAASFCQKTKDSVPVVKTDYLAKSKSQKTAAFIFLGIGVTTLTIASVADLDLDAVGAVVVVGGAATIASIPLFIAAGKNKKRARNMITNIKMENTTIFENQSFCSKPLSCPCIQNKFINLLKIKGMWLDKCNRIPFAFSASNQYLCGHFKNWQNNEHISFI